MWADSNLVMEMCAVNTVFSVLTAYRLLAAQPSICRAKWSHTPYPMLYQQPHTILRYTSACLQAAGAPAAPPPPAALGRRALARAWQPSAHRTRARVQPSSRSRPQSLRWTTFRTWFDPRSTPHTLDGVRCACAPCAAAAGCTPACRCAGLDFVWPFLLRYPRDKIAVVDEVGQLCACGVPT